MTIVYTVGHERNYDKGLAHCRETCTTMRKIGKSPPDDPSYPGGWVFETADAAILAAKNTSFAVYELRLPGTWAECTYEFEEARHLLVDAIVIGKLES